MSITIFYLRNFGSPPPTYLREQNIYVTLSLSLSLDAIAVDRLLYFTAMQLFWLNIKFSSEIDPFLFILSPFGFHLDNCIGNIRRQSCLPQSNHNEPTCPRQLPFKNKRASDEQMTGSQNCTPRKQLHINICTLLSLQLGLWRPFGVHSWQNPGTQLSCCWALAVVLQRRAEVTALYSAVKDTVNSTGLGSP